MSLVRGLAEALRRLGRIDIGQAGGEALERAAVRIETAVKQTLSHLPGDDHAAPWLRTGELRTSVTHQIAEQAAVVGSADPVAVDQELGTRTLPPRPFLAPTAAAEAEGVAHDVAELMRGAVEG